MQLMYIPNQPNKAKLIKTYVIVKVPCFPRKRQGGVSACIGSANLPHLASKQCPPLYRCLKIMQVLRVSVKEEQKNKPFTVQKTQKTSAGLR